jgi:hypothetical protein
MTKEEFLQKKFSHRGVTRKKCYEIQREETSCSFMQWVSSMALLGTQCGLRKPWEMSQRNPL